VRTPLITITELTVDEANQLLADKVFASLTPSQCSQCTQTTGFSRRLFQIMGVKHNKQTNDEIQHVISLYFKQQYSIEFIFFKTQHRNFFVDSAVCANCKSTAIMYDITFDDELFSKIAKSIGKSPVEVKDGLERMRNKLSLD
jgi:hypothetical protein